MRESGNEPAWDLAGSDWPCIYAAFFLIDDTISVVFLWMAPRRPANHRGDLRRVAREKTLIQRKID